MLDLLFSKRASLENPSTSLSDPANWLFEAFGAQPTTAKVVVSQKTALQLTAFWSAVNTISDTLASLPVRLVHSQKSGKHRVIKTHPALRMVKVSPNPFMSPTVYRSTLQAHTLTHGNSYALIVFNRSGEPIELWPLSPQKTKPVVRDGVVWFESDVGNGLELFPASEIVHIPALARDGLRGMSIVAEQREAIGHAIALQQFGAKFFANGAKPGGLVSFENKIRDPVKVREQVQQQYSGDNTHGLLVLDNGAKYSSFAIPPEDAQFLQSREMSIDDVGRMFRLPAHFLNKMGQATFNNLEQMGAHFVQFTMMPWITRWEQEYTRKLLSEAEIERGFAFKFVVAGLMRGDIKTRSEVYSSAITNGWMTRNEVRGLEELNPLDGLDDPLMPLNMTPVGEDPEPEPEPEPAPEPEPEPDPEPRSLVVLQAMAERMVAKEVNGARAALRKDDDAELRAFYDAHAGLLARNLAISEEVAREYCNARCALFEEGATCAEFLASVQSTAAPILIELTQGGLDETG